jgi:ligand-binding sensor domain-containing protein
MKVVSADTINTYGIRFVNINIKDGLSQNTVYNILQDNRGYMWFATQDGLNRFDGSSFKTYKNDRDNLETVSINTVSFLLEDSRSHLWVGTGNGLNEFNPETETFKR